MTTSIDDVMGKAGELGDAMKGKLPGKRGMTILIVCLALIVLIVSLKGRVYYDLGQNEILFVKEIGTGKVHIHKAAGWKWLYFGESTVLRKSFTHYFSVKPTQGSKLDQSLKARFGDNGHGNISGSIRINTPLDDKFLIELYSQFKTQENIEREIIETTLEKAVYFAGPLMTSIESASTKRNMLLTYVEDQAQYGIYKTVSEEVKVKDPVTGIEKTATQVRLITDEKQPGGIARHEESLLAKFGFKSSNMTINDIEYDEATKAMIKAQQDSMMAAQVAVANAKKAEQDAITAEKSGQAAAATAKWKQEVLKATEVTKAEQGREVARIDKEAAEFTKQRLILEGQGEAEKRRLIMAADGALDKKLKVAEAILGRFAQEFGKQKWVPEVQFGATSGGGGGANVTQFMDMMMLGTFKTLGLDMTIPSGKTAPKK